MKYVILSPYGVRTGGPEACYQLSDSLLRLGFEAEMWLVSEGDVNTFRDALKKQIRFIDTSLNIPERSNIVDEYAHYMTKPFQGSKANEQVTYILPEVYMWMLPLLLGAKVLIWWLSVDNAFRALADINLNLLRSPLIKHAVQSEYANKFTQSLGLNSTFLTDYTVVSEKQTLPLTKRPLRIAINAGKKVIFDVDAFSQLLLKSCPAVDIVKIVSLSREQVYEAFSTSRVFIDLGNFPGKDRMAREALLLGATIVVGSAGAGMHEADYPISKTYRPHIFDLGQIAKLATHMALNPTAHESQFDVARQIFSNEKANFDKEVIQTFC
jgi:hypothetical protein